MNRVPPTRRLSTGTAVFKLILPGFLALGAVALIVATLLDRGRVDRAGVVVVVLMLGGTAALHHFVNRRLADEVLDGGDFLRIRVGAEYEDVLIRDIERVEESIWLRGPRRLELVLRSPGKFGRVVAFIPRDFIEVPLVRSSLFEELTERVDIEQRSRSQRPQ